MEAPSALPSRQQDAELTHSDPGVQAQHLHKGVVEDDSDQGDQDVCQAHIKDNRGPYRRGCSGKERGCYARGAGYLSNACFV